MANVVLGIDRLHILVLSEVDLSVDPQDVVLERDIEVLLLEPGGAPKLELFSPRPIDGRANPRLVACWPRRSLASDQRIAYPSYATDMRQLPRNYKLIHIFQHCMLLPCCV